MDPNSHQSVNDKCSSLHSPSLHFAAWEHISNFAQISYLTATSCLPYPTLPYPALPILSCPVLFCSVLLKRHYTFLTALCSPITSVGNFVAAHSEASNDNMCDEFHDGTGFLTHHLALTNSFEVNCWPLKINLLQCFHCMAPYLTSSHILFLELSWLLLQAAVRSVDPSVTMPYWDFTIEGEAIRWWCDVMLCDMIWCNTMWCNTIRLDTK